MESNKTWIKYKKSGTYRRNVKKYRAELKNKVNTTDSSSNEGPSDSCHQPSLSPRVRPQSTPPKLVLSPVPLTGYDSTDEPEEYATVTDLRDEEDYYSPDESENEAAHFSSEIESEDNFKDFFQKWAIEHNIRHVALKPLIFHLNRSFNAGLPKDPRTLLGTNISSSSTALEIAGGTYWHQSLEVCLRSCFYNLKSNFSIEININIDGLPIYQNGKDQFWPILFNVHAFPEMKPMVIGIFYGHSKPTKVEEYLKPFVDELATIMDDGIIINDHKLEVKVRAFICDSPARAFIKGKLKYVL